MINQSRKLNEALRIGKVTMHQVNFILHELQPRLQPSAKYKFYSTTEYDKVLSSHTLIASDYYYYAVSNGERAIIIGSVSSTGDKIVCGMGYISNKRQYKIYLYHVEGGYISNGKFEDFVDQFFYDISLPVSVQQVQESFFQRQFIIKKRQVTSSSAAEVNVINNNNNDEDNDDGESDNGANGPSAKQLRRTPSRKSAAIHSKLIQPSNKKNKGSDNSKNNPVLKNGNNTTVLDNKESKKLEKMKNDFKENTDELNQRKTIVNIIQKRIGYNNF